MNKNKLTYICLNIIANVSQSSSEFAFFILDYDGLI